jgi:hypothetical protein
MKPIPLQKPTFALSDATARRINENDDKKEALIEATAARESQSTELIQSTGWTADRQLIADRLRAGKLSQMHEERSIRAGAIEVLDMISQVDQPAAKRKAFEELETAKKVVRELLQSIGFIDGPIEACGGRNGIQNGEWLWYHPLVIQARATLDTVSNYSVRDARAVHVAEIEKLDARIERAKNEATAGLM